MGRKRKNQVDDLPLFESEEDKKFREYMERQQRLAKKYSKFKGKESFEPNFESLIYMGEDDDG